MCHCFCIPNEHKHVICSANQLSRISRGEINFITMQLLRNLYGNAERCSLMINSAEVNARLLLPHRISLMLSSYRSDLITSRSKLIKLFCNPTVHPSVNKSELRNYHQKIENWYSLLRLLPAIDSLHLRRDVMICGEFILLFARLFLAATRHSYHNLRR